MTELLTVEDLAEIYRTTPKAIHTRRSRNPQTLPPSFKLGGRVVWSRATVEEWIQEQERVQTKSRPELSGALMLDQNLPECGICQRPIGAEELSFDYTRFGIGYTHTGLCQQKAREIAWASLADDWGLDPIERQCLHGVGQAWTDEEFLRHDQDCTLRGLRPYPCFDHMRMWRVREGSPWSPFTNPGGTVLTSEPYVSEAIPVPDDSWLWDKLGYRLDQHRYDELSIHHPAVNGTKTTFWVWTRAGLATPGTTPGFDVGQYGQGRRD